MEVAAKRHLWEGSRRATPPCQEEPATVARVSFPQRVPRVVKALRGLEALREGIPCSFLEPFCGHLLPKVDNIS